MSILDRMKELNQKKFPTQAERDEAYYVLDKLLSLIEAGDRLRGVVTIDDEGWQLYEDELIDECENYDRAMAELEKPE